MSRQLVTPKVPAQPCTCVMVAHDDARDSACRALEDLRAYQGNACSYQDARPAALVLDPCARPRNGIGACRCFSFGSRLQALPQNS